jgi:putative transposase
MSLANPRWGAPRIHGELMKLGIDIGETTVAKYMVRPRRPSSQTWKTFLKNHLRDMVSTDFFVVPTATFRLLFVFLMLSHDRRRIVHFGVTDHPTAEWTAQQLINAFPLEFPFGQKSHPRLRVTLLVLISLRLSIILSS